MKEIEEENNRYPFMHNDSKTELEANQDTREETSIYLYDYKAQAIKGNFMPSIIKLEKNEVNIDDVFCTTTGNTLLHLAVHFSFFNVIKTLIEVFHANINIPNATNQTPLHLNCKNTLKDIITFTYLINHPSINIEAEDQGGLRAIDYAVINNFNIAFLFLIAKGTDLIKADQMGNGLIYYALVNDNKFVVSFLYSHLPTYSINAMFYDQQVSLADVLITNKNTSICKFISKYYYDVVEEEKIDSCTKFISEFPFYNRFNYEALNTILFFKQRNLSLFLNSLFSLLCCCLKKRTKQNMNNNYNNSFNYRNTNLSTNRLNSSINRQLNFSNREKAINIDICYENRFYNFKLYFYNYILKKHPKVYLGILLSYIISLYIIKPFITNDLLNWFSITFFVMIILLNIVSLIGILFNWNSSSMFIKEKHSYKDSANNVFNSLSDILQKKQLELFPTEETICQVCLIHKDKSTNHCRSCKRCVRQLYFHSALFNRCFNKTNVYLYILFLLSMALIHGSYIISLWKLYNNSLSSNYIFTQIIIWLFTTSPLIAIMIIYMIVICGIIMGKLLTLIICLGTDVPYYNMFRYHKKEIGEKMKRSGVYVGIPKTNLNTCKEFFFNSVCLKKKE